MAALGEKLRREREARGVSLREIAAATRIHENFLRALEESDYGALPGSVFVTGFLRNYATHLGLDADKIVAEFEAMKIEPPTERNLVPDLPDLVDEKSSMSTLRVIGSLFLILVIYVAYVNWPGSAPEKSRPVVETVIERKVDRATDPIEPIKPETEKKEIISEAEKSAQPPVAQPPVAQPVVAKQPVAKQPVAKQPAAKQPAAKQPVAKTPVEKTPIPKDKIKPPVAAVKKKKPTPEATLKKKAIRRKAAVSTPKKKLRYSLVVEAQDEDAWILVVVDDEIERDMFLRAGQKIIIRGNDSINFTTGNASQIKLTLNGKPLKFEIPQSNVLRSWNLPLPETE